MRGVRLTVLLTLVAAAGVLMAALAWVPARQQSRSRADSGPPVRIDFVAVDGRGAPVIDLKPDEIEVWIGHFQVPVASLTVVTPASDERAGRILVLVLDDVTVPLAAMARVKDIARGFVSKMIPGDRMAIVTLDGTSMDVTDDPSRLRRAIDAYTVRATGMQQIAALGE